MAGSGNKFHYTHNWWCRTIGVESLRNQEPLVWSGGFCCNINGKSLLWALSIGCRFQSKAWTSKRDQSNLFLSSIHLEHPVRDMRKAACNSVRLFRISSRNNPCTSYSPTSKRPSWDICSKRCSLLELNLGKCIVSSVLGCLTQPKFDSGIDFLWNLRYIYWVTHQINCNRGYQKTEKQIGLFKHFQLQLGKIFETAVRKRNQTCAWIYKTTIETYHFAGISF